MHARAALVHGYRNALKRDNEKNSISSQSPSERPSVLNNERFLPENTQKMEEPKELRISNNALTTSQAAILHKQEYLWYKGKLMSKNEAQQKQQRDKKMVSQNISSILIKGTANGTIQKMTQKKYDEFLIEVWKSKQGKIELIKRVDDEGNPIQDYPVWWNQYKMPYWQLKAIFKHEKQEDKFDKYLNNLWNYEDELYYSCTQLFIEIQRQKQQQTKPGQQVLLGGNENNYLANLQNFFMEIEKSQQSQKELEKIQSHLSESNLLERQFNDEFQISSTVNNSRSGSIQQNIQQNINKLQYFNNIQDEIKQQQEQGMILDSCEYFCRNAQNSDKQIEIQKPKVASYYLLQNKTGNGRQRLKNVCNIF